MLVSNRMESGNPLTWIASPAFTIERLKEIVSWENK